MGRALLRCATPAAVALALAAALACLPGLARMARAAGPDTRPNILFIFSDDHGAQAIGAYGSERIETPAIDRLANEGMRFDRAYCGNSICAPSRATILTGLHSHKSGHTSNERVFDNRAVTFPELLRESGYQTALIGKWHLNAEPEGFDWWDILIGQGTYYNPDMIRNGQYQRNVGYATDLITDRSIEWLSEHRDTGRPFLLMTQHKAPHRSWEPALRHLSMYADSALPEPATLFDDGAGRSPAMSHAEMSIARHLWPGDLHLEPVHGLTPEQRAVWDAHYGPRNAAFRAANLEGEALVRWKYQRYAKDYLRCVAAMDEGIGRMLAYLDSTGLSRNTIVIYSSDQGWFLGEHGMFDKRWMYEESLRMPLIVRWPGVTPPGAVNADLVQNVDVAPTLLEAAGVAVPGAMQGRSLEPLLSERRPSDWRRSLYYQFYEDRGGHRVPRHRGVRTERYKLIEFYRLGEWEMFDVERDPDELVSVAEDPAYAGVRDSLERELRRLQESFGVSDAADLEYDRFEHYRQRRWALMDSIGRMPPFGEFVAETVETRVLADRTEIALSYQIGGERVPATLYVPAEREGLRPGIVLSHGGASKGGPVAEAESAAVALCRRGFVVMTPVRIGHGSRRLGMSDRLGDQERMLAAAAKRFEAAGSTLLAQTLAELWFAHAYLERMEGVHMLRVGVLGLGEGADLALLLAALDPEVAAVASIGGAASFEEAAARPLAAARRLASAQVRAWGDMGGVVPLVFPQPVLAPGVNARSAAMLEEGREWYELHGMSDRVRAEPEVKVREPDRASGVEQAAEWLERRLMQR